MKHSKNELLKMFSVDEPKYASIVERLTEEDYSLLNEIIKDTDPDIAVRAIFCMSIAKTPKALEGVISAVKQKNPDLREAAAWALRSFENSPEAIKLIEELLNDEDIGVRKAALKTVEVSNLGRLKGSLQLRSRKETNKRMIELTERVLRKFDRPNI